MSEQPIELTNVRVMSPQQRLVDQATANARTREAELSQRRAERDVRRK